MDNILEEYRNTINLQGRNSEEIRKALMETFKEVDKTIPRKVKWTQLDVPGHVECHGEQARNENGRKLD